MTNSQYGNTGSLSDLYLPEEQPSCREKKEENEFNAMVAPYPKLFFKKVQTFFLLIISANDFL